MRCLKKIFLIVLFFTFTLKAQAVRLKDIMDVEGVRGNYLVGYGLVVGLKGTGDGDQTKFTVQSVVNMLEKFGIRVQKEQVKLKNVAAVLVTAYLPPYAKPGQKIDVEVSALGDAKNLQGGTLLMTPLTGPDGRVYALAQGPVSIGGFAAGGAGAQTQVNHPTAGKIPNGAIVEREVPMEDINSQSSILISLKTDDFSTTSEVAEAINSYLRGKFATPADLKNIELKVPEKYRGRVVALLGEIGKLEVRPDLPARVVIDEKTGTVIMGENVRISKVAVAHGNLSVTIKEAPEVVQPLPFGRGETAIVPRTEVTAREEKAKIVVLEESATLGELIRALNAVGATSRELIAILQAIKSAGALHADLIII
ncbi:flagellar basal body P-ring protein [Caldimicrobium thiodismutans]|jgi:flagellar P-ring protein precursor FlgI|uniref:Flagellar P-ring protein n=1 Tax=Caldimicrobium thiodismutans TaxID=1653476 RepID=A0A0U5AXT5_9BACT|nr:flagellar basal body P-ring protein FlgI [Caldimicrobium thiodismutans]BAU22553.1 flagellar basal body P-ring protein [Caldimicrobium thiodismutans]